MEKATGILELGKKSDGRLRTLKDSYEASPDDPIVPGHLIDRYGLRPGVELTVSLGKAVGGGGANVNGQDQQGGSGSGGGGGGRRGRGRKKKKSKPQRQAISAEARRAKDIESIDGLAPDDFEKVRQYDELTPIDPQPRLTLEYEGCPPSCRLIDLFCPIGYGQRGMIVSPPKAGKTTLLQDIAFAIEKNHPDVITIALLIDERPEEVTEFRRHVPCTVWASSNDHTPERHVGLAISAAERCKRWAEQGKDVVVVLDSLTRLGRAFNTAPGQSNTGRTLSGGLDAGALAIPKQIFGGARKFEEGGSLTIIATALIDTGSRGDQVIFEEFKGTGNMELILDRSIAEKRVFPAIDLAASGTRKEEKLLDKQTYDTVNALRRRLLHMPPHVQMEQLLKAMERFPTNADLAGNPQSPANPQTAVTARR